MSVGGGIRKVQDIDDLLRSGADKVIVNTSFVKNPKFKADTFLVLNVL